MTLNESSLWGSPSIERMSFRMWLLEGAGVQAYMSANPKKPDQPDYDFLVVYGETRPIKDTLKQWKFRYYQGTWSTPRFAVTKWTPQQTQAFNELTGLDVQALLNSPVAGRDETGGGEQEGGNEAEQQLNAMSQEIEKMEGRAGDKAKQILDAVQKEIEKIATMTDEAAQSDFVKRFWQFSAKFHKYSFHNQMLIFLQNQKATYVNSEQRWRDLGRMVDSSRRKEAITIIAPRTFKKKNDKQQQGVEGEEEERRAMYFVPVKVWDISSTMVIPGQEDQAHVFEPQNWKLDTNEARGEITTLINAGVKFAQQQGIVIDYKELGGGQGGFSTGSGITINSTYDGINKFGTLVHEITHELFHHTLDRNEKVSMDKQTLEHDAEATAFVVLSYFGFESKDSARYLAIWKADSKKIRERGDQISKAAKQIIQGLMANMEKMQINLDDEDEEPKAA